MAIRIRVHPQGAGYGGAYGGLGGYGGVNAQTYYNQQLNNERQVSDLRLDYERQLWQEKLKAVQLEAQIQYGGYGNWGRPQPYPYGMQTAFFAPQTSFFGGLFGGGLF